MLSVVFNVFLIIIGFGLLIFVHELGHFLAAKWAGIRTEAFAVGMGPVVCSWRKGIGFCFGSTHSRVVKRTGKPAAELNDVELAQHGLGETEYSLRWLPIGGFVKMLGQEDANPNYVSDDPRSYNRCPIGKRMVVVSAGVVMNIILAVLLFILAFMIGVRFEAPVVGQVSTVLAAGTTPPQNAEALGIKKVGLLPGDEVIEVNGDPARTFADVQIAAAMSKPDTPVELLVKREGYDEPLRFSLMPEHDPSVGLLSIGVMSGSSTQLHQDNREQSVLKMLRETGLAGQGVTPGMRMTHAGAKPVVTLEQVNAIAQESAGRAIRTTWQETNQRGEPVGEVVQAELPVEPVFQILRYVDATPDSAPNFEQGFFGLTPLVEVVDVPASSANDGMLQAGDAILKFGDQFAPRMRDLLMTIQTFSRDDVAMTVIRGGREVELQARVRPRGFFDTSGMLGVQIGYAWDTPVIAKPMHRVLQPRDENGESLEATDTAVASLLLLPGTRIIRAADRSVQSWADLRAALRDATEASFERGEGHTVEITIENPTSEREVETIDLALSAKDVQALHALGWRIGLSPAVFEPVYTLRTAEGNPFRALAMGVEETNKFLVLTYLTIDRLFRRTVGVDQLRGPVGIIHIGATIADRGILYLVFLLAVISVNLAVINFLPLPIVDGGLFLFLVYEKLKGRPPSLAFQNVVTIMGLFLIGAVFLLVTYHDIMRLVG